MNLDQQVRAMVYDLVMKTGHPPLVEEIAASMERPRADIAVALKNLADAHMLVLQKETGEVLMANPFSAVPTPFLVRAGDVDYFGNCIWDAMGIPSMLSQDGVIQASCGDCGTAMELHIQNGELQTSQGLAHFALHPRKWWDNIVFT
jgi:hypothetical protein